MLEARNLPDTDWHGPAQFCGLMSRKHCSGDGVKAQKLTDELNCYAAIDMIDAWDRAIRNGFICC